MELGIVLFGVFLMAYAVTGWLIREPEREGCQHWFERIPAKRTEDILLVPGTETVIKRFIDLSFCVYCGEKRATTFRPTPRGSTLIDGTPVEYVELNY